METSPAVKLRSQVVGEVVRAIIGLSFLLYGVCAYLIVAGDDVPEALWLAAGNASGALVALLINSKNDTAPQEVVTPPGESLDVTEVRP